MVIGRPLSKRAFKRRVERILADRLPASGGHPLETRLWAAERAGAEILDDFDRETAEWKSPAQLEIERIMARRACEDAELAAAASDGEREAIMARQVREYAERAAEAE